MEEYDNICRSNICLNYSFYRMFYNNVEVIIRNLFFILNRDI